MENNEQKNKSSISTASSNRDNDGGKEPIVDQAKHAISNVADQAREQVTQQIEVRKDRAVDTIGDVASALRGTGDKLKEVPALGDMAGRAADQIERVAQFFDGRQVGDVVRDVERFARREPAIFLGAAFALGLIGGRFLTSSSHRNETSFDRGGTSASKRDAGQSYRSASAMGLDAPDALGDTQPMRTPVASNRASLGGAIKPSPIVNATSSSSPNSNIPRNGHTGRV